MAVRGLWLVMLMAGACSPTIINGAGTPGPPRQRAVVHIGPYKTGSSALQAQMTHEIALMESYGWSFPYCSACMFTTRVTWQLSTFIGSVARELNPGGPSGAGPPKCTDDIVACFSESLAQARSEGKHVFMSSELLSAMDAVVVRAAEG